MADSQDIETFLDKPPAVPQNRGSTVRDNQNEQRFIVELMDSGDNKVEGKLPEFTRYNMNHKRRGKFVIFNHTEYQKKLNLSSRSASIYDVEKLETAMKELGFEVVTYNNLTLDEIKVQVDHYANEEDHTDADCFGCAILTHGSQTGGFEHFWAEDDKYKLETITDGLKHCRSLQGKPKLFFIQACRGKKTMEARQAEDSYDSFATPTATLPLEADVFIAYSTLAGHFAWKRDGFGSWFIGSLCDVIKQHGRELELNHIMVRVNYLVARYFESNAPECKGAKQVPSFSNHLLGEVYFDHVKETDTKDDSISANVVPTEFALTKEVYLQKKMKVLEQKQRLHELQIKLTEAKLANITKHS